ncbi:DUF6318 family protein [Pimelobacter simplex]|uniref:DUF6318 family protein n=1 Tax=Nocardioides simplex TaxID=2045 RepID=UPI003AAD0C1D
MRAKRRRCVVALALVVLGVGGCNADPPDPGPTWSMSGSAEVTASSSPTVTPGPEVPVLPAAAREASEAGARAFVEYYWELVNYAQATGDVRALRAVSGPSCEGCQAGIAAVRRHYRAGGRVVGGAAIPQDQRLTELSTKESSIYAFRVQVTTAHEAQEIIAPDGSRQSRSAGTDTWHLYVLWVNDREWRLDVMESR